MNTIAQLHPWPQCGIFFNYFGEKRRLKLSSKIIGGNFFLQVDQRHVAMSEIVFWSKYLPTIKTSQGKKITLKITGNHSFRCILHSSEHNSSDTCRFFGVGEGFWVTRGCHEKAKKAHYYFFKRVVINFLRDTTLILIFHTFWGPLASSRAFLAPRGLLGARALRFERGFDELGGPIVASSWGGDEHICCKNLSWTHDLQKKCCFPAKICREHMIFKKMQFSCKPSLWPRNVL